MERGEISAEELARNVFNHYNIVGERSKIVALYCGGKLVNSVASHLREFFGDGIEVLAFEDFPPSLILEGCYRVNLEAITKYRLEDPFFHFPHPVCKQNQDDQLISKLNL